MNEAPVTQRNYSFYQFCFELCLSWVLLYFLLPIAYFKVDYLIRKHSPDTLLHQVSGVGLEDFAALAEQAAAAGADELAALMTEITRLHATGVFDSAPTQALRSPPAAETPVYLGAGGEARASLVQTSKRYIGTPYRWGGEGPSGFDCSGYVQYVYRRAAGVDLPRSSAEQYSSRRGRFVGRYALQPGDLVFFATRGPGVSHVGMYLGDNKFIHAPSSGNLVRIDSLNDPYYWKDRYVGGKSFI
jgi:cell wall-associated NlpC family hydrolase